jgi:transcriptional regulator with XRE-family HTH domain
MLTPVTDVGRLVQAAKGSSGRSFRALAGAADVAVSTLTRTTNGSLDPTVNTLDRILGAAGYSLRLEVVRRDVDDGPRLGDLADAWTESREQIRPDWTRWRALLDRLALERDRVAEAIYASPPPSGHPIVDCLLAAVAEKLADDAGLRWPSWTAAVPPLATPWQPPTRGTHHEIAPQFAARGLLVDVGSLFRERATVGA